MNFSIETAAPADVPSLLELIRELARFEHLEHEVKATADSLHVSLFGSPPVAGALLARCGRELAGYAIYFFTFSSFVGRLGLWLDDLYVRPAYRRQGLGRALLEWVADIGAQRGCGRFEWTALRWNESALRFHEKLGARQLDEWVMLRMEGAAIKNLAREKEPEAV
jgi:GNAT superfamily N-acetyltransferase